MAIFQDYTLHININYYYDVMYQIAKIQSVGYKIPYDVGAVFRIRIILPAWVKPHVRP